MQRLLNKLNQEIADYFTSEDFHSAPDISQKFLREILSTYDFQKGQSRIKVFEDVVSMMKKWSLNVTSPNYLGLFNPSVTLDSIIAESLVALYNPQLAVWEHSPIACEIERHVLNFIGDHIYNEQDFYSCFTTGGSEANMTAMLVGLTHKVADFTSSGLVKRNHQPVIYVSNHAHHSFEKIAKSVGLGEQSIRRISTNDKFQLNIRALESQYQKDVDSGSLPIMVVGTAGTTSFGSIDPLKKLAEFCRQNDLWYHVDAAWGGAARISSSLRNFLTGIEYANSVTVDAHKWFSVGMGAGMFFTRHVNPIKEVFSVKADYMPDSIHEDVFEPYLSTILWSRRFIGLKLFMTLAQSGSEGIAQRIEHQVEMGDYLKQLLADSGWEIVNSTPLPVVCFTHKKIKSGEKTTSEILGEIKREGKYWISDIHYSGTNRAFRACITSFKTQKHHIEKIVSDLTDKIS